MPSRPTAVSTRRLSHACAARIRPPVSGPPPAPVPGSGARSVVPSARPRSWLAGGHRLRGRVERGARVEQAVEDVLAPDLVGDAEAIELAPQVPTRVRHREDDPARDELICELGERLPAGVVDIV